MAHRTGEVGDMLRIRKDRAHLECLRGEGNQSERYACYLVCMVHDDEHGAQAMRELKAKEP